MVCGDGRLSTYRCIAVAACLSLEACLLTTPLDGLEGPPLEPVDGGLVDDTNGFDRGGDSPGDEHADGGARDGQVDGPNGGDARDAVVDNGGPEVRPPDANDSSLPGDVISEPVVPPEANDGPPLEPRPIYTNIGAPLGVWATADRLYWVTVEPILGLWCAPKDGSGPIAPVSQPEDFSPESLPFDVVVDDAYIYYSVGLNVYRRKLGAKPCEIAPEAAQWYFSATNVSSVRYLTPGHGHIYATDNATVVAGGNLSAPDGAPGATSVTMYANQPGVAGVAVSRSEHPSELYWVTDDAIRRGTANPNTAAGPGEKSLLFTEGAKGSAIVSDGQRLYWILDNQRIQTAGFPFLKDVSDYFVASEPFGLSDLAIDDRFLYLSKRDKGEIWSIPLPQSP